MGKFRIYKDGYIESVQNIESDSRYGFNQPIDKLYIGQNRVKKVCKGSTLLMDGTDTSIYRYFYMYAVNAGGGTVSLQNNGNNAPDIEYSRDGVNWTTWDYSAIALYYTAPDDYSDTVIYPVFFRGSNPNGFNSSSSKYSKFAFSTGTKVVLGGNIMSLIDKTNFNTLETLPASYCFYSLFSQQSAVYSCKGLSFDGVLVNPDIESLYNLQLPATTLTSNCYHNMFWGSTSMIDAPVLPATTLTQSCYQGMFADCSSLINAPGLPAKTAAISCYQNMFTNCTFSIAPALPATTLAQYCYREMFSATHNITSQIELPATDLASGCYYQMFYYSSVNNIKCLAETNINTTNLYSWLSSSTGTFVKKTGVTFPSGKSGIPNGWTVEEI